MSKEYLDRNQKNNTDQNTTDVSQKKIDPVAQLKWINNSSGDQGFGIYEDDGEVQKSAVGENVEQGNELLQPDTNNIKNKYLLPNEGIPINVTFPENPEVGQKYLHEYQEGKSVIFEYADSRGWEIIGFETSLPEIVIVGNKPKLLLSGTDEILEPYAVFPKKELMDPELKRYITSIVKEMLPHGSANVDNVRKYLQSNEISDMPSPIDHAASIYGATLSKTGGLALSLFMWMANDYVDRQVIEMEELFEQVDAQKVQNKLSTVSKYEDFFDTVTDYNSNTVPKGSGDKAIVMVYSNIKITSTDDFFNGDSQAFLPTITPKFKDYIQETYSEKIKYVNWGFYDTYNGSAFDVLGSIKIF